MAKADKIVAAGRTYSVVLLTLAVAVAAVAATEFSRWLLLSQGRSAVSQWIVADFIKEDFEDWWHRQQSEGGTITDTFALSPQLCTGRERTYEGFGAASVRSIDPNTWSVSVHQPTRQEPQATTIPGVPQVPDTRANVPDLLLWTRNIDEYELNQKILVPLSKGDAAIEKGTLGLNQIFKQSHPDIAKQLPALLQNDMSTDGRWLYIGAEQDKAALQLQEVARAAKVTVTSDSFPPSVYRDIERSLTTTTVKVPIIDTEMTAHSALWVLSLLTLLTCLVLQATLDGLQNENVRDLEEPWLLIAAQLGLSRALSTIWLALNFAIPIAVPCVVFVSVVLRAKVGTITNTVAIGQGLTLLMLLATGIWSSTRTLIGLRIFPRSGSVATAMPSVEGEPTLDSVTEIPVL